MKHKHLLPLGLLAGAAVAFLAPSAHAQVTFANGNIFLGFEEPGNGYDYVVNLGPASYFVGLSTTPGTTNITNSDYGGAGLGNLAADLASTSASGGFGAQWYNNSATQGDNLQWGVFGAINPFGNSTGFSGDTIFETIAESTPGSGSTAPTESSPSSQGTEESKFASFSTDFKGSADTANSTVATFEATSGGASWTSEDPSEAAFSGPVGIEQPTSGTYIGPTNSELDLYELIPTGDTGATGTGTLLGSFELTSAGNLEFTSAATAAVPEPSTYAAIGLGAAFLLLFRRTRKSRNA